MRRNWRPPGRWRGAGGSGRGATRPERADRRQKDLAAMARAGFRLDVARQVIDADGPPPEADQ